MKALHLCSFLPFSGFPPRLSLFTFLHLPRLLSPDVAHLTPNYLFSAVLADNLKSNPGIKWQYFSSEEGIFTVFPAHKFQCKGTYEHRSR